MFNIGGSTQVGAIDFLKERLACLPGAYYGQEGEYKDFVSRLILQDAEYDAFVYNFWKTLYTYIDPATAPEEWVRWILTEWMGWKLIPAGYPLARLRRLLANLHAHYKRAGTVWPSAAVYDSITGRLADPESGAGILLLLREFGIHGVVTDSPIYPDADYYGSYGSEQPLKARVVVQYIEPWETGSASFVGDYYDVTFPHESPVIVDIEFVVSLVEWSRPAATLIRTEFVTAVAREQSFQMSGDIVVGDVSIITEGEFGFSLTTEEGEHIIAE